MVVLKRLGRVAEAKKLDSKNTADALKSMIIQIRFLSKGVLTLASTTEATRHLRIADNTVNIETKTL